MNALATQAADCAADLIADVHEHAPAADVQAATNAGRVHIEVRAQPPNSLGFTAAMELLAALNATPDTGTTWTPGLAAVTGVTVRHGVGARVTVWF